MTMNASTYSSHPDLWGHLSYHSQELLSQTINFDVSHGDDIKVGNRNNNKRRVVKMLMMA